MKNLIVLFLFAAVFSTLAGCVKQPVSSEKVLDDRPAISFKLQSGGSLDGSYLVFVDNLTVGSASLYMSGKSALRVLSGTHLIRVEKNGATIYEESFYLGDGAVREILIP